MRCSALALTFVAVAPLPAQSDKPLPPLEVRIEVVKPGKPVPRDPKAKEKRAPYRLEGREIVFVVDRRRVESEKLLDMLKRIRNDKAQWSRDPTTGYLRPRRVVIRGDAEARVGEVVRVFDVATSADLHEIDVVSHPRTLFQMFTLEAEPRDGLHLPRADYTTPAEKIPVADLVRLSQRGSLKSAGGIDLELGDSGSMKAFETHLDKLLAEARDKGRTEKRRVSATKIEERANIHLLVCPDELCHWANVERLFVVARKRGFWKLGIVCREGSD